MPLPRQRDPEVGNSPPLVAGVAALPVAYSPRRPAVALWPAASRYTGRHGPALLETSISADDQHFDNLAPALVDPFALGHSFEVRIGAARLRCAYVSNSMPCDTPESPFAGVRFDRHVPPARTGVR